MRQLKRLRGGCFGCAPKTRQELCHPRFDDALHWPKEWSQRPPELLLGQDTTATSRVLYGELMMSGHTKHAAAPADQLRILHSRHLAGECQLDDGQTGCGSGDEESHSLLKPRLIREAQVPRAPSRPELNRHKCAPHSLSRGCNRDARQDSHRSGVWYRPARRRSVGLCPYEASGFPPRRGALVAAAAALTSSDQSVDLVEEEDHLVIGLCLPDDLLRRKSLSLSRLFTTRWEIPWQRA